MLVVEAGCRGEGQEPSDRPVPKEIIDTAKWWSRYQPPGDDDHPSPAIVPQDDAAKEVLVAFRKSVDAEYREAEKRGDAVGTTVWARANENARKLSLLHAISVSCEAPTIDLAAAMWATQFAGHQTRRMLHMAAEHVFANEFDDKCKQMIRVLRNWKERNGAKPMPGWRVNRRLVWKPRDHEDVRESLMDSRIIEYQETSTNGTPGTFYHLL